MTEIPGLGGAAEQFQVHNGLDGRHIDEVITEENAAPAPASEPEGGYGGEGGITNSGAINASEERALQADGESVDRETPVDEDVLADKERQPATAEEAAADEADAKKADEDAKPAKKTAAKKSAARKKS